MSTRRDRRRAGRLARDTRRAGYGIRATAGYTATPSFADSRSDTVDPTTIFGALVVVPSFADSRSDTVDPTVIFTAIKKFYAWLRLNGVDIANTNIVKEFTANIEQDTLVITHVLELDANDYFELMFAVTDLNIKLDADVATSFGPATPSVTLEVVKVA